MKKMVKWTLLSLLMMVIILADVVAFSATSSDQVEKEIVPFEEISGVIDFSNTKIDLDKDETIILLKEDIQQIYLKRYDEKQIEGQGLYLNEEKEIFGLIIDLNDAGKVERWIDLTVSFKTNDPEKCWKLVILKLKENKKVIIPLRFSDGYSLL